MADFKPKDSKAPSAEVDNVGIKIVRGRADFGKTRYDATGRQDPALGSSDAIEVCTIPAESIVLAGYYKITVGEGASVTCDVGYSSGGTDNISNLDLQTAGNWTILTDPNLDADDWDYRSAATTIYAAPDGAMDKAVLDLMYLVYPLNNAFVPETT